MLDIKKKVKHVFYTLMQLNIILVTQG